MDDPEYSVRSSTTCLEIIETRVIGGHLGQRVEFLGQAVRGAVLCILRSLAWVQIW